MSGKFQKNTKTKKKKSKLPLIIAIVALLIAACVGGYYLHKHNQKVKYEGIVSEALALNETGDVYGAVEKLKSGYGLGFDDELNSKGKELLLIEIRRYLKPQKDFL